MAVDVLFAADLLFLEKLKLRAAVVISTLGNGSVTTMAAPALNAKSGPRDDDDDDDESIDIYEILHAAWLTRVQRLEEFAARYIAYRLEFYIDDPEFAEVVKESAERISARQETDTIELLDDIRWYLSERFRLRFEDSGLEDMMDEDLQKLQQQQGEQDQTRNGGDGNAGGEGGGKAGGRQAGNNSGILPHWGSTDPITPVVHHHHHHHLHSPAQHPPFSNLDVESNESLTTKHAAAQSPNQASPNPNPPSVASPENANGIAAVTSTGTVRTLDGNLASDEFASDAINYQVLLGKIDRLLERLRLDA